MGMQKYLRELWKKPGKTGLKEILRERMIKWRREPAILKIAKPTRLDRARALGYKAKKGFVIARVRLKRGGKQRPRVLSHGRRSAKSYQKRNVSKGYKWIAEERAARKFKNLEVLNSYFLAKDGLYYWFEIILVDPDKPEIKADPKINWICAKHQRGRVFRGLTSAGKKSRSL